MILALIASSARADYMVAEFATQTEATDFQTAEIASCDFPFAYVVVDTNLPLPYQVWTPEPIAGERGWINKMRITRFSNAAVRVLGGQASAVCDQGIIYLDDPMNANLTMSGAGGLDTGSEAADTWYSVWAIREYGQNNADVLLSTSTETPTMPSPYNMKRLLGWVRNDGSSNIMRFEMVANGTLRDVYWDLAESSLRALTGGTATAYTTVTLDNLVAPTRAIGVYLYVTTNVTSGVNIRWSGANGATWVTVPALSTQQIYMPLPQNSNDDLEYQNLVALGSTNISVLGYRLDIQ